MITRRAQLLRDLGYDELREVMTLASLRLVYYDPNFDFASEILR